MRKLLCLFIALPGLAVAAPVIDLVEIPLDTPDARERFLEVAGDLDVLTVKPGSHARIAVTPADREILARAGCEVRLLRADLEAARPYADKGPGFGVYHTWSESVAFVDSLHLLHPDVVSAKWSIGQSVEGRDIWAFRVSDNPDVDEDEPEVLIDGMHHAREIMAGEFVIMFAEYLATNYGTDPEVTWLVDNRELYLVPMVNPDGIVYNEVNEPDGGGMWRKNRRDNGDGTFGVDLNRNYPFQWGYDNLGSSPLTSSYNYRGPSAGSEPETQALMGFINGRQFRTQDSVHTYTNLLYYPWGYTGVTSPDHDTFVHMGQVMTRFNGYTPTTGFGFYPVNGSTFDWSYGDDSSHGKIFAFTTEIGGDADGFWPPEERRGELFQENLWPHIYLMRAAGAFVTVHSAATAPLLVKDIDPGESGTLTFTAENQSPLVSSVPLEVTLSTDDPWLQLGSAVRTIGALAPLGTDDLSGAPVPFTVDPACPPGRIARIDATLHMPGGDLEYPLLVRIGPAQLLFADDLEGPLDAWILDGNWAQTGSDSHSPSQSLTDSPGGDYLNEQTATATLGSTYLATALRFWHRFDLEDAYDYGHVQVSADGGPWNTIASYTGSQAAWTEESILLGDYLGQELAIRFALVSDYLGVEDGWYVDDVEISGVPGVLNEPPSVPVPVAPLGGVTLTGEPDLTVAPASDPEGAEVIYGFRVFTDEQCTQLAASADDVTATTWTATGLAAGDYWWRAWAGDGQERSDLSATENFRLTSTSDAGYPVAGNWLRVLDGVSGGNARLELGLAGGASATVDIHDARGRRVRRIHVDDDGPGTRTVVWDGRDGSGRMAASGVYFVRVVARDVVLTGRVVVVR